MKMDANMYRYSLRGFGLVELMIAVLLGLLISAALIQAYIASKTSYRVQDSVSEIQESGRFALNQIAQDIRMAGQAGCMALDGLASLTNLTGGTGTYNTVVKPNTGVNVIAYTPSTIIGGANDVSTYGGINTKPHSDVLTIGRVSSSGVRLMQTYDNASVANAKADLIVESNSLSFQAGDTILISDCHQAALFRASAVSGPNGSGYVAISHQATNNGKTYNSQDILSVDNSNPYPTTNNKNLAPIFQPAATVDPNATTPAKVYGGAQVMAFQQVTYFIGDTGRKTSKNHSIYALYQQTLGSGGTAMQTSELVTGVEDMQIEYGITSGGSTPVTKYVNASHVTDFANVGSIRISLLVRSTADTGVTSDTSVAQQLSFPAIFTLNETVPYTVPSDDGRLSQIFFTVASIRAREATPGTNP